MRFMNRETQFPGKRKLIKVDGNNVPIAGESPILVNIVGDEGTVYEEGTRITADNLNKGNWRDDGSVSFAVMENNELPYAKADETQIVTKSNGETWIIPPEGLGCAKEICDGVGSVVTVAGFKQDISFVSDPQTQIDSKLDKITSTAENVRAYCADGLGQQVLGTIENLNVYGFAGDIPRRNGNRSLTMPAPVDDYDAANKEYVDTQVATKQAKVADPYIATGVLKTTSGIYLTRVNADTGVDPHTVVSILTPGNNVSLTSGGTLNMNIPQKYIHNCELEALNKNGTQSSLLAFQIINTQAAPFGSISEVIEAVRNYAGCGANTFITCSGAFEHAGSMYIASKIRGGMPGEALFRGINAGSAGNTLTASAYVDYYTGYSDHVVPL